MGKFHDWRVGLNHTVCFSAAEIGQSGLEFVKAVYLVLSVHCYRIFSRRDKRLRANCFEVIYVQQISNRAAGYEHIDYIVLGLRL